MTLTPSNMVVLGKVAPYFKLNCPKTGDAVDIEAARGTKGLLVIFMCNHCPFVRHIEQGLISLGKDYQYSDIGIVGINANNVLDYPEDAPKKMAQKNYIFPYLYDETQAIAKAYGAACTPDFFLFDHELKLVYRGQFDASRPNSNKPITGDDLRNAMDSLTMGKAINTEQNPSIGCNIKWKH